MSEHYYHKPLVIAYSGGKDSEVLADLAIRSGVPIEISNSHTTVDAPETVYHIREQFKRWRSMGIPCVEQYPVYKGKRTSMWDLIRQKGLLPTRRIRYCCAILKEAGGKRRLTAIGVRRSESPSRHDRAEFQTPDNTIKKSMIETAEVYQEDINDSPYGECQLIKKAKRNTRIVCSPIIDWEDADIWEYIRSTGIAYNPLYNEGFTRVGCIGCPLAGGKRMRREFERWPKYERLYRKSCQNMYNTCLQKGKPFCIKTKDGQYVAVKNGDEIFDWWVNTGK